MKKKTLTVRILSNPSQRSSNAHPSVRMKLGRCTINSAYSRAMEVRQGKYNTKFPSKKFIHISKLVHSYGRRLTNPLIITTRLHFNQIVTTYPIQAFFNTPTILGFRCMDWVDKAFSST